MNKALKESKGKQILILFLLISGIKIILQLGTRYVISLDSWVIYHIIESIIHQQPILPRGVLYSYYPFAYVFLLPFAYIWNPLMACKFIYPLLSSLSVIPLYYLMSLYVKDTRAGIITLTVLFIDDFMLRTLAVTPQGIALIFFFSSLYFLLTHREKIFFVFSLLTLLTHHLTSLVLVVFVVAYLSSRFMQHNLQENNITSDINRGKFRFRRRLLINVIKRHILLLLFVFLFFLSWFIISYYTGISDVSGYLILRALPLFLILSLLLIFMNTYPFIFRKIRTLKFKHIFFITSILFALLCIWIFTYSTHKFIAHFSLLTVLFIPIYFVAPLLGIPFLLKIKSLVWPLFFILLSIAFVVIVYLDLVDIFDAFRFLPFLLLPLILVIGKQDFVISLAILFLSVFTLTSHLALSYRSLTYTDKQVEAANWCRNNLTMSTIATDTKLSALFLGLANKSATFEGSAWIFNSKDLISQINSLNNSIYKQYPIKYIAVAAYMFTEGADISWNKNNYILKSENLRKFQQIGEMIYRNEEIIIWEISQIKYFLLEETETL
jgi:hypothetical protein